MKPKNLQFNLIQLGEEVNLKPEHIELIEKEPIDVLIKYIDLTDKNLNREGIKQITKDEDHEELRYCVRSILDNIPWIRKIFIVMPNEKVRYFKPIEEIKDRIVYVKDKDLLGFESANIHAFHFFLWNMTNFGLSENFILMDDDYFIGKPINKTQFFYYDEKEKKVLPSILSDQFSELDKSYVYREYEKLFNKLQKIDPYTSDGWSFHTLSAMKLMLDNFEAPIIEACFTHNAISLNLKDIKEIFEFIKEKYKYANNTLYNKTRDIFNLQSQSLFNTYLLNVKKRKINMIPRKFIDLKDLKKIKIKDLEIELFVINTSGENTYSPEEFDFEKKMLEEKYNKTTPYEIISKEEENNKTINNLTGNEDINKKFDDLKNQVQMNIKKLEKKYSNMFICSNLTLILLCIILVIYIFNNKHSLSNKKIFKNRNKESYLAEENKLFK